MPLASPFPSPGATPDRDYLVLILLMAMIHLLVMQLQEYYIAICKRCQVPGDSSTALGFFLGLYAPQSSVLVPRDCLSKEEKGDCDALSETKIRVGEVSTTLNPSTTPVPVPSLYLRRARPGVPLLTDEAWSIGCALVDLGVKWVRRSDYSPTTRVKDAPNSLEYCP